MSRRCLASQLSIKIDGNQDKLIARNVALSKIQCTKASQMIPNEA